MVLENHEWINSFVSGKRVKRWESHNLSHLKQKNSLIYQPKFLISLLLNPKSPCVCSKVPIDPLHVLWCWDTHQQQRWIWQHFGTSKHMWRGCGLRNISCFISLWVCHCGCDFSFGMSPAIGHLDQLWPSLLSFSWIRANTIEK